MFFKVFAEGKGGISNPVAPEFSLGFLISKIVDLAIFFGFLATFFFLLTGAFQWITSGGEAEKLTEARRKMVHALIGLILVVSVWVIFELIGQFLGIDFTSFDIPTLG